MKSPANYYRQRLSELEKSMTNHQYRLRWLSVLRLLVFLALFPDIFFAIPANLWLGIVLTIITVSAFLFLVKIHNRQTTRLRHIQALVKINEQEIESLNYKFDMFYPGIEFIDTTHPYSFDMDLFGEGSLFQSINRTTTCRGREHLAILISQETLDADTIYLRQASVQELVLMPKLIQDFRAAGSMNAESEGDLIVLNEWINQPSYYLKRKGWLQAIVLLPAITLLSILLAVFIPFFRIFPLTLFLSQLIVVGIRLSHTSREHAKICKRLEALKKYQSLLKIIEEENYNSKELIGLNKIIKQGNTSAAHAIQKLATIVAAFDNRLNILAAIFLEGFLLWDIQCMVRLERWKTIQGRYFNKWIDVIARFDALVSLSTFAFNHKHLSYPLITDSKILDAKNMGHILIPHNERICNDFRIVKEGDFMLITGANMAGKSTFLRTVATNMILAMAGAPVCAEEFIFRPMALFSSMRTSDSLKKHESYFYAELRRLKEMLNRLQTGERLFIILDEILKGTNSFDKQKGSHAALQKILGLNGTGIIATHDLDLVAIQEEYPERIQNMCFEIEIDQAKISFDYKLREGVTTKMNALLLMRQMGIIGS